MFNDHPPEGWLGIFQLQKKRPANQICRAFGIYACCWFTHR
jgi:hypothetical protein